MGIRKLRLGEEHSGRPGTRTVNYLLLLPAWAVHTAAVAAVFAEPRGRDQAQCFAWVAGFENCLRTAGRNAAPAEVRLGRRAPTIGEEIG